MCNTEPLKEWLKNDDVELWGHYQYAAVSIIIKDEKILIEKRNSSLQDPWAGQFALPGGHYKERDGQLFYTAVREAQEETGIQLDHSKYLGYFGPFSPRNKGDLMVIAYVFRIDNDSDPNITGSSETEFIGWIDISDLLKGKSDDEEGPIFMIRQGTIWGLTARILSKFLAMCNINQKGNN